MRGWWACRRRQWRSSVSFFRAARGRRAEFELHLAGRPEEIRDGARLGSRPLPFLPGEALGNPGSDSAIEFIEFTGEKMIRAGNFDHAIVAGERRNQRGELVQGAELVVAALHEEFWLGARRKVSKIRVIYRRAQSDQVRHSRVLAANSQAYPGT